MDNKRGGKRLGIIHGIDEATNMLSEVIKMRPPIDVELKVCDAQQLLTEMLAILQDCKRCKQYPDKLFKKLFWANRKQIPQDSAYRGPRGPYGPRK